ncbi:MAG: hypothetical protein ABIC91_04850 [Nanoarchaeota archaeon]|nr:hypothetical protein [Nanoarchaeota archaeon]MBU1031133.1 hypothetical protein [Nanoarchaeota archaeon]MBU1850354.1 hypothetical protein [Nanoarchaeota archaeon]
MIPKTHIAALRVIVNETRDKDIFWFLGGSTNLALQGIDVSVNDIDLLSDEKGVYELEKSLKQYVVKPVFWRESETIASHYGQLNIDGVDVEIMGELDVKSAYRQNIKKDDILMTKVDDFYIPCCSLKHEYDAYVKLGRPEKVVLIKKFLDKK